MKTQALRRIYFLIILLTVFVVVFSSVVFIKTAREEHNTLDNLITFVVTILSMLIALFAYHISLKTYISIDAVNAISRMDGNVMENENYRTNILSIIRRFNGKTKDEAKNQMLGYLEGLFKNADINSGARLADNIQEMIDIVVLFSFVIYKRKVHENGKSVDGERFEKLIDVIDSRVADFEQLSEGSCVLVQESVKLLKAVYYVQSFEAGYDKSGEYITPLDVRGMMLKNAISRTIYFNYIGLLYLNKAMVVVRKYTADKQGGIIEPLAIDAFPILNQMPDSAEKHLILLYLEEAQNYFEKAVENIRDELMWNAFIKYNIARTKYLLFAMGIANNHDWDVSLQQAIDYRAKLVAIIDDIMGSKNEAYFQRAFSDQQKMAELQKIRLKIATGASDINYSKSDLPDIGIDEFRRLTDIYNDITLHTNLS